MKLRLFHRTDQLSDQERIRQLEQKVRLQTITLLLLALGGILVAWRVQRLFEIVILFDDRIGLLSENAGLIIDCLNSITELLQKLIPLSI